MENTNKNESFKFSKVDKRISYRKSVLIEESELRNNIEVQRDGVMTKLPNTSFRQIWNVSSQIITQGSWGLSALARKRGKSSELKECKIIPKSRLIDTEMFRKDLEASTNYDHVCIKKIFEFQEDHYCFQLITEVLKGGSLERRLLQQRKVKEKIARKIINDILLAICYCHNYNILLENLSTESFEFVDNDVWKVKLSDIQLKKHFKYEKVKPISLTRPVFDPPEMFLGDQDKIGNVWTVGVILQYMLVGYPPFLDDNEYKLKEKIKMGIQSLEGDDWEDISPNCKNVIRNCLVIIKQKRLTPREVLESKWLSVEEISKYHKLKMNKEQLENYKRYSSFKKIVYKNVSIQSASNKNELSDLKQLFTSMDKDKSGTLDMTEVIEGLKNEGFKEDEMNLVFEAMDISKDRSIDIHEFIAAMLDHQSNDKRKDKFELAIKQFDQDGDGHIDKKEIINLTGFEVKDTIEYIFDQFDTDGDDRLTQSEFKELLMNSDLKF